MPGFARRPLAFLVSCLFAGMQAGHAATDAVGLLQPLAGNESVSAVATPASAAFELAAADDVPVHLRSERKFNVLAKPKPPLGTEVGLSNPVARNKDDHYPLFLVADQIEGRTDEATEASGEVELRQSGTLLFGDRVSYRPLDDEVEASGHVRLLQEGSEMEMPYLRMKLSEQIGHAEQVDFRMLKEVASKVYRPQQSMISVTGNSSTTTSGAPMMLYVPNSYGLPTVAPASRPSEANGRAERVDFEGENHIRLTDTSYSTCKPGQTDWYLKAAQINLDYDENVGDAKDASLWFKDVPLFYSPTASFSLNNQRHSGFLHPFFSSSTRSGFDFTVPYYWNIAPNYDATFYPRYMSKRGFQLGAEAQYLDYNFRGISKLEYLPNDELQNRQRYAYNLQHQHTLGRGLSATLNWNATSDNTYWEDMSSRLLQTSQVQLAQQVSLEYSPNSWLQSNLQVLRYQTLQPDPANPVTKPYFLEPQFNFSAYRPNVLHTDFSMVGQFSRFTHPDKVEGDRLMLYPQFALPIVHPAFQITPKVGLHLTQYTLDRQAAGQPTSLNRTLPIFSVDSTVVFEREGRLLDKAYLQTLEPRLYYVYIPHKDQRNFPVFDSGLADFNFAQIFSENRYSGQDRINDANQLTAALSSAILDADTGVERFKAMIGQRYYLQPQRVDITGENTRRADFSNLIAGFTGLIAPKTYADAAWEYDYRHVQSERLSVGARFQPDFGKVASASYRYTRDPLTGKGLIDQFDLAGQWPLSSRIYAVGRYNYSLRDMHPLETIAGLEYNAGCWAGRFVAQRLEAISGSANTSLFFQLELNDFGSVGSNPLQLLRRSIPGYGKTNELPDSGSLLTPQ